MPPTILIAEDYDDNRELLRLLLAGANYDVREARNGQECLDLRSYLGQILLGCAMLIGEERHDRGEIS